MEIERKAGFAPAVAEVARRTETLQGPCIGCKNCTGLCAALIEALLVPELVLGRSA